jgi:hypothetical protein
VLGVFGVCFIKILNIIGNDLKTSEE